MLGRRHGMSHGAAELENCQQMTCDDAYRGLHHVQIFADEDASNEKRCEHCAMLVVMRQRRCPDTV